MLNHKSCVAAALAAATVLLASCNGGGGSSGSASVRLVDATSTHASLALLVHGNATAPTASLVTDDNHPPSSSATLKLRLVNGLTGAAPPLSLDAAFAVIASNIAPGTASPYAVAAASTALRVDVFSPSSLTPLFTDAALGVPGNAVYTLFMLGDASAPVALLRRDR